MRGWSALAGCAFALAACGLGVVGTASETATNDQTGRRAPPSSGDGGQDADTAPVLGSSSSSGGPTGGGDAAAEAAAPFLYDCPGGVPVTSCATCTGHPTGCLFCDALGGSALKGSCLQASEACYYNVPVGWKICRCAPPSTTGCPATANQVCNTFDNGYCQPCGDQYSNGFACRGGGTCSQATATCQL